MIISPQYNRGGGHDVEAESRAMNQKPVRRGIMQRFLCCFNPKDTLPQNGTASTTSSTSAGGRSPKRYMEIEVSLSWSQRLIMSLYPLPNVFLFFLVQWLQASAVQNAQYGFESEPHREEAPRLGPGRDLGPQFLPTCGEIQLHHHRGD